MNESLKRSLDLPSLPDRRQRGGSGPSSTGARTQLDHNLTQDSQHSSLMSALCAPVKEAADRAFAHSRERCTSAGSEKKCYIFSDLRDL